MDKMINTVQSAIGSLKGLLVAAAGLIILAQIVFGGLGNLNVIGGITGIVDLFVGSSASLTSVVVGTIVVGLLSD